MSIYASSGNSNVLDSLSSAPITISDKISPTIYISPDALLYNAEDMYINKDYRDAKAIKHNTKRKKKAISFKKNVSQKVKVAKPIDLKKTLKELPNHKYFTVSVTINLAIVNSYKYKYDIRLYKDIKVELAHNFDNQYILYFHKNTFLYNPYTSFIMVRPPPRPLLLI